MLKFVPPVEEKQSYRYASYAAGEMKLHGGIGFAKNSLNNRMWTREKTDEVLGEDFYGKPRYKTKLVTKHAFLLESVDGEWFVLYEIKPGSTKDELPWMKEYIRTGYYTRLYTEYEKTNDYYQQKIADGSYSVFRKSTSMSTDEYVDFRLRVERERLGIS